MTREPKWSWGCKWPQFSVIWERVLFMFMLHGHCRLALALLLAEDRDRAAPPWDAWFLGRRKNRNRSTVLKPAPGYSSLSSAFSWKSKCISSADFNMVKVYKLPPGQGSRFSNSCYNFLHPCRSHWLIIKRY